MYFPDADSTDDTPRRAAAMLLALLPFAYLCLGVMLYLTARVAISNPDLYTDLYNRSLHETYYYLLSALGAQDESTKTILPLTPEP